MKAKNRKDRLDFLISKTGFDSVKHTLLFATDKYVKQYYEAVYPILKDKPDYIDKGVTCNRCGIEVEWISNCRCGENRAVFSDEDWLDDINGNDELLEGDSEFLNSMNREG